MLTGTVNEAAAQRTGIREVVLVPSALTLRLPHTHPAPSAENGRWSTGLFSTGERGTWAWCGSLTGTVLEATAQRKDIGDVILAPSVLAHLHSHTPYTRCRKQEVVERAVRWCGANDA